MSNARNTGLDNAQGKYIFFVDSDDYVEATHVQDLLPENDEDFVYGGYVCINPTGENCVQSIRAGVYQKANIVLLDNFQKKYSSLLEFGHVVIR